MKQVEFSAYGDPSVLTVVDADDPRPGRGQALVRVEAIGVNFGDVLFRRGDYFLDATFPAVPGYETAGRIVAVGDGVESEMIGRKVLVIPSGAPPCPHRRVTRAAGLAPSAAATTC